MIYLYAFLIGGLICMVGQLLMDLTKLTPARIWYCLCVWEWCWAVWVGILNWWSWQVPALRCR